MVDCGDFLEVTSAITGKRVLFNKLDVITVTESVNSGHTYIRFGKEKDMTVVAKESYDEIIEAFIPLDEEEGECEYT